MILRILLAFQNLQNWKWQPLMAYQNYTQFWSSLLQIEMIYKSLHLTLKVPITTAADDKFCEIFPNLKNKQTRYGISWESSASRRFSWNIMPYMLLLKKRQNLKLSSAAHYMWRFLRVNITRFNVPVFF